jgi:hypothetical protein
MYFLIASFKWTPQAEAMINNCRSENRAEGKTSILSDILGKAQRLLKYWDTDIGKNIHTRRNRNTTMFFDQIFRQYHWL